MTIEINGMAQVILTVSRFEVAREFYGRLLPEFGMKVVFDGDRFFYCVGARTAIGIQPCDPTLVGERFACTTSACEPARVRTWTNAPLCSERWARSSFAAPPRHMGAGLLLGVVQRPGRHQARGKLCSGRRSARGGSAVSPRPTEYGLRLRRTHGDVIPATTHA